MSGTNRRPLPAAVANVWPRHSYIFLTEMVAEEEKSSKIADCDYNMDMKRPSILVVPPFFGICQNRATSSPTDGVALSGFAFSKAHSGIPWLLFSEEAALLCSLIDDVASSDRLNNELVIVTKIMAM